MSYSQYGPSQITYGHPRSLVGQHRPSYALSQPVRAAQEAFPPGHYPPDKRSSDFAKVWAACNDNQPFHDQWYQLPSSQFTYCKLAPLHQPATELDDRVSRWTRSVPYPCLLMPQQEIIQHPTRPIPSQCHVIPKSPVRAHQRHVPRNVRRPAPEHNPLGHNEALESPAVLLQAPSRRDRQWYLPSNDKPVRSSKLLHEVTSAAPPVGTVNNVVQSGVPVLNSMKRTHEQSLPVIPTPPEEDMVTPTGVSIGGRPTIRVKSGHERIDDATTMARGHGQSEPFRTPCYIRPADMKTPSDDTTTMATVQALRMMYQNPKTDYGSPPQAMLAVTLIHAVPQHLDPRPAFPAVSEPLSLIDNLVERFTMGIYQTAMGAADNNQPIAIGAEQMLWELYFVCLQRFGPLSPMSAKTERLAGLLAKGGDDEIC